jgi:hypothetical protein
VPVESAVGASKGGANGGRGDVAVGSTFSGENGPFETAPEEIGIVAEFFDASRLAAAAASSVLGLDPERGHDRFVSKKFGNAGESGESAESGVWASSRVGDVGVGDTARCDPLDVAERTLDRVLRVRGVRAFEGYPPAPSLNSNFSPSTGAFVSSSSIGEPGAPDAFKPSDLNGTHSSCFSSSPSSSKSS